MSLVNISNIDDAVAGWGAAQEVEDEIYDEWAPQTLSEEPIDFFSHTDYDAMIADDIFAPSLMREGKITDAVVTILSWRILTLNDIVLIVSNEGHIKNGPRPCDVVEAHDVLGTPFQMCKVMNGQGNLCQFYIHDLVYMAFMGDVPKGWTLAHKPGTPTNARGQFLNHLVHLDIYPKRLFPSRIPAVYSLGLYGEVEANKPFEHTPPSLPLTIPTRI